MALVRPPALPQKVIDAPLPGDAQDEIGVLGSLMVGIRGRDLFAELEGVLDDSDFLDPDLGKYFAALKSMHGAGHPLDDWMVLKSQLEYLKVPEAVRSAAFIHKMLTALPNAAHLLYYADNVRKNAQKRRLIALSSKLLSAAYESSSDPETLIRSTESDLARMLAGGKTETKTIGEAAAVMVADLRAELARPKRSSCMTGILDFDEMVGPMMRGELVVIAARPGRGKTAFGLQVAMHAARSGRRAFFVSLEMQYAELATREVCRIADINSRNVRSGQIGDASLQALDAAAAELAEVPVLVWAPPTGNLSQIRGIAKHLHAQGPLSLVVVDYLQLVAPGPGEKGLDRHMQIQNTSAGLRALSKELDCPVIALAQLNRAAEKEEPNMSHLRESGAIEQDANIIVFLHSPDRPNDRSEPFNVTAIVEKHRAGQAGRIPLVFYPIETRFSGGSLSGGNSNVTSHKRPPPPKRRDEFDAYNQGAAF